MPDKPGKPKLPLGLYAHLPFCPSRCPYCDFFAQPFDPKAAKPLMDAMISHIGLLAPKVKGRGLDTIYLGGGTPAMWPVGDLARLLDKVRSCFDLAANTEISLEANPGVLSARKLVLLKEAGFNRLSIGGQSFDPATLKTLGRRHSASDTARAVDLARGAGFDNLNLDLIYGLPGQNPHQAVSDVKAAISLTPEHISLYELTLSPHTPFGRRYAKGVHPLPDEADMQAMEEALLAGLEAEGFERYEVSNFARPGFTCRHNRDTWRGGEYLALGPGAHGHLNAARFAMKSDVAAYVRAVRAGEEPLAFYDRLTPLDRARELIMLGLRTREGADLDRASRLMGRDATAFFSAAISETEALGWAGIADGYLKPTSQGLAMADAAARLFFTDKD